MRSKLNRKLNRLSGYDYSSAGVYFVTFCVHPRLRNERILGDIANEEMILNWRGGLARQYWERIPEHYPNVKLDKYCIMPDHIHGIICIIDMDDGETRCIEGVKQQRAVGTEQCSVPTARDKQRIKQSYGSPDNHISRYGTLSKIIKSFKNCVTSQIRKIDNDYFGWQRSFYERIVRNETELDLIRLYIINNSKNVENWGSM